MAATARVPKLPMRLLSHFQVGPATCGNHHGAIRDGQRRSHLESGELVNYTKVYYAPLMHSRPTKSQIGGRSCDLPTRVCQRRDQSTARRDEPQLNAGRTSVYRRPLQNMRRLDGHYFSKSLRNATAGNVRMSLVVAVLNPMRASPGAGPT
ncbi:hypothetical protein BURKHO8Y_370004 [Burkholderia sp. 8Y]|nr:hypothetical protein BURKHO8Y_370004 [Burkholderia sp. 8Y]